MTVRAGMNEEVVDGNSGLLAKFLITYIFPDPNSAPAVLFHLLATLSQPSWLALQVNRDLTLQN